MQNRKVTFIFHRNCRPNEQYETLGIRNAVNVLSHHTNSPKHLLSASMLPAFCPSMFYLAYPPIPLESYHLFYSVGQQSNSLLFCVKEALEAEVLWYVTAPTRIKLLALYCEVLKPPAYTTN